MISGEERAILRDLAARTADLADDTANGLKIADWTRLNGLDGGVRPQVLVHLWPLAWEEVLPESELRCAEPKAQRYERELRRAICLRCAS